MNVTLLFALALCSGAALGLAAHKKTVPDTAKNSAAQAFRGLRGVLSAGA